MKKLGRKFVSILLSAAMLFSSVPTTVLGTETLDTGLCEHHTEHTAECGYVEASAGAACTHVCEEGCYETVTSCVHTHNETCTYVPAVEPTPCGHVHDENCGYAAAVAEVPCGCPIGEDGTLVHTEGCGYVAPVAEQPCHHAHDGSCGYSEGTAEVLCDHVCSAENGCVASVLKCQHTHDDMCGYAEAVEGNPCSFAVNGCAECEKEEEKKETEAAESVCTCETDDPTYHAPFCDRYIAPAEPECYCVEKCTEDNINVWCDVCGFDYTDCIGENEAVPYADYAASVTTSENVETQYEDFASALSAAQASSGSTLKLLGDVTLTEQCWIKSGTYSPLT